MRVLHVVHGLPRGGLERGVVNLTNHLPTEEFVQAVCCLDQRGELADQASTNTDIFELHRGRHDVKLPFRLAQLICQWRPEIVHCRNWNAWLDTVLAVWLARLGGAPRLRLVWSFHGFAEGQELPPRRRLISRLLNPVTDQLLAVCHDSATRYAAQAGFPSQRFKVVYNGVDCRRFMPTDRQEARRRLGVAEDGLIALTVASLTPIKNHLGLLEAVALLLRDRQPKLRFLFLGEGPMRGQIEAAIGSLNLTGYVILPGASDQVLDYLQAADLFILPSSLEGMSNAILEAMAVGLPVIANRVGGNCEIVVDGETGLLCSADDLGGWAESIARLADNGVLRERMGAAGRSRALEVFSIQQMMANYADFYRRTLPR